MIFLVNIFKLLSTIFTCFLRIISKIIIIQIWRIIKNKIINIVVKNQALENYKAILKVKKSLNVFQKNIW